MPKNCFSDRSALLFPLGLTAIKIQEDQEVKKVVYSVAKRSASGGTIKGIGYVTDTDLITACTGKNGISYVRVFEDCVKDCHPTGERKDEFKGEFYEIREVEYETKYGSKDAREIEIIYSIWFKFVR